MKRLLKLLALSFICILCFSSFGAILSGCKDNNNGDNFVELSNWYSSSETMSIQTNVIVVEYDEETICKFSCDNGSLAGPAQASPYREIETTANERVSWICHPENSTNKVYKDFVTITLNKNSKVIGYAVIKVDFTIEDVNLQVVILIQKILENPVSETEAQELIDEVKIRV